MLYSGGMHLDLRAASSSRTGTASTHFSHSKYCGSAGNVGFLWPHLYTVQTKHITGSIFSTVFWVHGFAAQQKMFFVQPLCYRFDSFWLLSQREINQIVPCGLCLFGKPQKDQICAMKLKIWFRVPLNPLCDYKSIEEMWSLWTILLGKSSIRMSTIKLFQFSGPVLINH